MEDRWVNIYSAYNNSWRLNPEYVKTFTVQPTTITYDVSTPTTTEITYDQMDGTYSGVIPPTTDVFLKWYNHEPSLSFSFDYGSNCLDDCAITEIITGKNNDDFEDTEEVEDFMEEMVSSIGIC